MSKQDLNFNSNFIRNVDDIMRAAQLASCLEVCGHPKPGNVHRLRDFQDTRFEHFIAGSIAIGPAMRIAALNGVKAASGELGLSEIGVGSIIRRAVEEVKYWHKGGNTHLGIIILFTPLAASAGFCIAKYGEIVANDLQKCFMNIVEATKISDAIEVYEAIKIVNPGGMGQVKLRGVPDAFDEDFEDKLTRNNLTLREVMKFSSRWDTVAWEFVNGLETAFKVGYPVLVDQYGRTGDINVAVVNTFLKLLSLRPDTLIARKVGLKFTTNIVEAVKIGMRKAVEVSERAKRILELGGLATTEGRKALMDFDEELAIEGLNPGSTADVLAASIFIALLLGLKI